MMEEIFAEVDTITISELDFLDNLYDNNDGTFSDWEIKKINEIYDEHM